MKRKEREWGKCGICGKDTWKGWTFKGKPKTFYCGCEGVRCGG